ncbi:MAG: hypothetical protein V4662_15050 [Verrucomicrobiota bacterium]
MRDSIVGWALGSLGHSLVIAAWALVIVATSVSFAEPPKRDIDVLIVAGAPGDEEYGKRFEKQVTTWKEACEKAGISVTLIGKDARDAEALEAALKQAATKTTGQMWLVMIGHGTFDNREVKFNLRGPDVTAKQLAVWCQPIQRELIVIDSGSASAGFLQPLAGQGRVIVTGTKSADEIYYTRFGEFFAPAIAGDLAADLDQDKQVSVLEAFRHASRLATEFYEKEERISTEHALIEDNGDGVGTRSEVIANADVKEKRDGARAAQVALVLSPEEQMLTDAQRSKRDELERKLEALKARRGEMEEPRYYTEVESLLRELAGVYQAL